MIAFRAPLTVAGQLENAARITGKDKTFLILEALREHLGIVVDRYGDAHQAALKKAQEEFVRSMRTEAPTPKRTGAAAASSGESSSRPRSHSPAEKDNLHKPRKFPKG